MTRALGSCSSSPRVSISTRCSTPCTRSTAWSLRSCNRRSRTLWTRCSLEAWSCVRRQIQVSDAPGTASASAWARSPQWQACYDIAAAREGRLSALGGPVAVRVGPLAVLQADRGAVVSTFGDPARPSVVVFDGYLFDRRERATALGFGTRAATDAELFGAGYARWGAGVFREFEGRYLAAVWDSERRRLLLGHDALGRHPAFYSNTTDGHWFGTNVLALASTPRLSNRPNRLSLALGMLMYWPEAGQTFFEAIQRVRPGHYLQVTEAGSCTEHEYWDPLPAEDEAWLPDD